MKTISLTIIILLATSAFGQGLKLDWARSMSGELGSGGAGTSVVVDSKGNIYTTGSFSGEIDFDPSKKTFNLKSVGSGDVFISKLDAAGNFIWAKKFGGYAHDIAFSIVVDKKGNVYTTGFFKERADFDPGLGIFNLSSSGKSDIFISKLDSLGNFVWAKKVGGGLVDYATSLALDNNGNIYATGRFQGGGDFDPGVGIFNLVNSGGFDVFILKLNNDGNFKWAKKIGDTSFEAGYSLVVDSKGNVYTTGSFYGSVDFDPGKGTSYLTSVGNGDVFISKLDSLGNFLWAKNMGGTSSDYGKSITVDSKGSIYIAGIFSETADFDPSANEFNLTSSGGEDIFISKLDSLGDFIWAKKIGGKSIDAIHSLVVDSSGNVYTTGSFRETVDFNPGAGVYNLTSKFTSDDIFISMLDANGGFVWATKIGGTERDEGRSLSLDQSGNLVITGGFVGVVDFDPGSKIMNLSKGGVFVLKLSKPTVGLGGKMNDLKTSIYPSPTDGDITIKLDKRYAKVKVTITNIMGQEVSAKVYAAVNTIDVSIDKKPGLYFIKVKLNENNLAVFKVIKM